MKADNIHEVYIGTTTGTFKRHISFSNATVDLVDVKSVQQGDEIVHINWTNVNDKDGILLAHRNGTVEQYDLNTSAFHKHDNIKIAADAKIVGLCRVDDNKIITAVNTGQIQIWNGDECKEINTNSMLDRLRQYEHNTEIIATGGDENPLKVWDLSTMQCKFTAKNVPPDMLQLRVPVWVSDMTFLNETNIVTVSRLSCVCLYDTRTQRRPVVRFEHPDGVYSCVTSTSEPHTVVTGGGKGLIHMIDLRKPGKIVHKYKGCVGGVNDVKCSSVGQPLVFSVSLDRRLRIHDLHTTHLLEEKYLKSRLNCLLINAVRVKEEKSVESEELVLPVDKPMNADNTVDSGDILYENSDIYEDNPPVKRKGKTNDKVKRRKV